MSLPTEDALRRLVTNDSLTLHASMAGLEAIGPLLSALDRSDLVLRHVRIDADAGAVVVHGEGDVLDLSAVSLRVELRGGDDVEIRITARLPDDWNIGRSFPALPPYRDFSAPDRTPQLRPSFFRDLQLRAPRLVAATHAYHDAELDRRIDAGLSLAGECAASRPLDVVRSLIGEEPIVLAGAIARHSATPQMRLSAPIAGGLEIGSLTVSNLQITLDTPLGDEETAGPPGIAVSGELRLGDSHSFGVSAQVAAGWPDWIRLEAAPALSLPGLEDVAAALGAGDVLAQLPPVMRQPGGVRLTHLLVDLHPARPEVSFVSAEMETTAEWPLWPGTLELEALSLRLDVSSPFDPTSRSTQATVNCRSRLAGAAMDVTMSLPAAKLWGRLVDGERLPLARLFSASVPVDAPLPADLVADQLMVGMDPRVPAANVSAAVTGTWPLPIDGAEVVLRRMGVDLAFSRTGGGRATVYGEATVNGLSMDVSATLAREGMAFTGTLPPLDLSHLVERVIGSVPPGLPRIAIGRSDVSIDSAGRFRLAGAVSVDLLNLIDTLGLPVPPQFASVSCSSIVVDLNVATKSVAIRLDLDRRLVPVLSLPIPIAPAPSLDIEVTSIELYTGAGPGNGERNWGLAGRATLVTHDLPAVVAGFFPAGQLDGEIRLDRNGLRLAFSGGGFKPPFPELAIRFSDDHQVSLGRVSVELMNIGIELGRDIRVVQELRATIPAEMNEVLSGPGAGGGARPLLEETCTWRLTIGRGISVVPVTSPFREIPLRTQEEDLTVWTEWFTLPDVGTFSVRVPEFAFSGGRWKASGGIDTRGQLSIPLAPIRWLFEKCGLPRELLSMLPRAVPLIELHLEDPAFYDQVTTLLGEVGPEVQGAFRQLATLLRKGADNLPGNIRSYLDVYVPRGLTFDVRLEPPGGMSLALKVEGERPLKVMLPAVVGMPPLPGLVGLTLRSAGFGLTAGGSVGVLTIDGSLDQIDVVSLTYALATGLGRDLSNRFVMKKTTALVPMAAPLPIPLFYEQVGWEYRTVFGLGMQLHARFPDPDPSLIEWVQLIGSLVQFFTQAGYYLHDPGHLPERMALPFTIAPTFLQLPSYLGGRTLGLSRTLPELKVADTLARALDGIKAGNLGWVIQAVPLKHRADGEVQWIRVGREVIEFGPLGFEMGWCITTTDEFQNEVLRDPAAIEMLAVANADQMLTALPTQADAPADKGFIVLLMGEAAAGTPQRDIFAFRAQFGMVLRGPSDFETGVRIRAGCGPERAIELDIEGRLRVERVPGDPRAERVAVAGEFSLIVAGEKLRLGSELVVVPGHSLSGTVILQLTSHLTMAGTLTITASSVAIEGALGWSGIGSSSGDFTTRAVFSNDGVLFEPFDLRIGGFGCRAHVRLPGRNPGDVVAVGVDVHLPPSFPEAFRKSLVATAQEVVTDDVNRALDELQASIVAREGFEASLSGLQSWLPGLCNGIIKEITRATSKSAVFRAMDDWAGANLLKRAAVAAAKATSPQNSARQSATPWLDALAAARDAAARAVDEGYRERLKGALANLVKTNAISVRVGRIGDFPGVVVYTRRPVLDAGQRALIGRAIDAVDRLPEVSSRRIRADQVLARMPRRETLLAQVRRDIERGVSDAVPVMESVGFETSTGFFSSTAIALSLTLSYKGRRATIAMEADLTRPDRTIAAIADAFSSAFSTP
jgi:hypothetical protein